jgi:hypothetical protein
MYLDTLLSILISFHFTGFFLYLFSSKCAVKCASNIEERKEREVYTSASESDLL